MPMMAHWRHQEHKDERQMALIGLLHGIVQGMAKPNAHPLHGGAASKRRPTVTFRP